MQRFSVKAAAKLTGLSAHTLRAWERRYSIVTPYRTKTGRRIYTAAEIERLRLLAALTEAGHTIANLAPMKDQELESLASVTQKKRGFSEEQPPEILAHYLAALHLALREFDLDSLEQWVLKARLSMSTRTFVLEITAPLLEEVGKLVCQDRLSIAQEHALSAILRNHLGEILMQFQKRSTKRESPRKNLPLLAFATPEGDLHEFGILLAALLAGARGFRFCYLGPNLPAETLAQAAIKLSARIVVVGSVEAESSRLAVSLRHYADSFLAKTRKSRGHAPTLWIGGKCEFDTNQLDEARRVLHTRSLADFDQRLTELG